MQSKKSQYTVPTLISYGKVVQKTLENGCAPGVDSVTIFPDGATKITFGSRCS